MVRLAFLPPGFFCVKWTEYGLLYTLGPIKPLKSGYQYEKKIEKFSKGPPFGFPVFYIVFCIKRQNIGIK